MTHALQPYRGSYLMPAFDRATVADVMRPGVMSCAPDTPLSSVAQTMATHHVHCVVVAGIARDDAGADHLIWGLVSDMDIVRAAEAGIDGHTAADAARTEVVTVDPSTPLSEATRLMDEHATAHLIVISGGQPAAVVSSLDIAGALAWGRA
jgi:acetoin utilization protein AcuB